MRGLVRGDRASSLLLATLLVTASLLAGCAEEPAPVVAPTTEPAKQYDEGDANRLDVPVLPSDPVAAGVRSTAEVPQWRLGEYWEYEITDQFTGNTITATRVVAGTDGGNYLVGFPIDAFSNDVLIFHMPGVGDVSRADLGFDAHDFRFQPLRFPLQAGDSWDTAWEGQPGTVLVDRVEGSKAYLSGSGQGWAMSYTFDADIGDVSEMDATNYMTYKVTKHGFGYDGVVRVPHSHDLIFFHGRIAGGLGMDASPRTDAPTTETVDIPSGYDRLAFTIILGNLLVGNAPVTGTAVPASGYYSERAVAPDGTVYELTALPSDPTLKIAFFGAGDPTGTWTLEHTAAGPGAAFIEGIGYHSIDVDLPSGCVVASFNAEHHKAPCNTNAADAGVTKDTSEL